MDISIFKHKDLLPLLTADKLTSIPIDYTEKYRQIKYSAQTSAPHLAAGVVLLLNYKELTPGNSEYVFQLIKRSDKVPQAGDISCPGGMLHPIIDKILCSLMTTGLLPSLNEAITSAKHHRDKESFNLIRLFLSNALREAWEEIGLNPFRILFLGALPCHSLALMAKTIFPSICLVPERWEFKLNAEVEKILEIPVSTFFDRTKYALLEIETQFGNSLHNNKFPCIVLTDPEGGQEILWGATFYIIMNYLQIIFADDLPVPSSAGIIKKVLSKTYISGQSR